MITENYIKMCEKAEEIQKWYKSDVKNVNEGDRYICKCDTCKSSMFINFVKDSDIDYINHRDMTDVDPTYKAMVELSEVAEFGAFWEDEGFIWLPTQEQLQEIILPTLKEKYNKAWNLKKMGREGNWVIRIFANFLQGFKIEWNNSNNITELWLAFVMKEKYNKIWTGEKWVIQKEQI